MTENLDLNIISNKELDDMKNTLEGDYKNKQTEMKALCEQVEKLHKEMVNISKRFVAVKEVISKRQGK